MQKNGQEETKPHVIESPLKRWPGRIELPDPDDFTNDPHWQTWRKAVSDKSDEGLEEVNLLFAYAGGVFIEKHGEWKIKGVGLAEFQSWQHEPKKEKTRFVSWVGKAMRDYMNEITNPKG